MENVDGLGAQGRGVLPKLWEDDRWHLLCAQKTPWACSGRHEALLNEYVRVVPFVPRLGGAVSSTAVAFPLPPPAPVLEGPQGEPGPGKT